MSAKPDYWRAIENTILFKYPQPGINKNINVNWGLPVSGMLVFCCCFYDKF